MQIKGILDAIYDPVQVTPTFKRRNFSVSYWDNPEQVEYLSFELLQERCKLLDPFKPGDTVIIQFHLKGRKWLDSNGGERYFNTLQAWNVTPEIKNESPRVGI